MWNRAELKSRAKITLKGVFWIAVIGVFLYGILSGDQSGNFSINIMNQGKNQIPQNNTPADSFQQYDYYTRIISYPLTQIIALIGSLGIIIGVLWNIFIAGPLEVGISRLFLQMKYEKENFNLKTLFTVFRENNYINIVKSIFMKNLIILLWTLLLIVPGIIKGYQYYFVPWILAEHPDMDYKTAMAYSKKLTDGQKLDMFILELSFIGWFFLGLIPLGFGVPLVSTYQKATLNELYQVLKENEALEEQTVII